MTKKVHIYTDGACRGNPGPGGWAAILQHEKGEKIIYGGQAHTTNNRMELTAVIEGLSALKQGCEVVVTTDSQYVCQGITTWIHGWRRKGWRTSQNKPVKNVDLWQALDHAITSHQVEWCWVKGHAGHPQNELADAYANKAIDEMQKENKQ